MYTNVITKETLTDKEFLSNEFEDLVYETTLDNDSFDQWLNENYSAADVFYLQEEKIIEKWKEYCKKFTMESLQEGVLDSYYINYTNGWKHVEGDK